MTAAAAAARARNGGCFYWSGCVPLPIAVGGGHGGHTCPRLLRLHGRASQCRAWLRNMCNRHQLEDIIITWS